MAAIITDKITDGPAIHLAMYPTTRNMPTLNVPLSPTFVKSNVLNSDDADVLDIVTVEGIVVDIRHHILYLHPMKNVCGAEWTTAVIEGTNTRKLRFVAESKQGRDDTWLFLFTSECRVILTHESQCWILLRISTCMAYINFEEKKHLSD